MRAVDAMAQESVSLATLINRAGHAVATEAIAMLGGVSGKRIAVVAGKGNNGNDGRVAARVLARRGARVAVLEPGIASVGRVDLVVDSAYGTGYRGEYEAPA